jgi:hypothetical protein
MRHLLILSSAVVAMGAVAASPASAETLTVQGVVAPYCNVNLTNVSSGTASIAFLDTQKVANLRLSCNSGTGTKMITNPTNGDLLSSQGNRINYAMKVVSPVSAFAIAETDTAPGDAEAVGLFTRSNASYSQQLANGVPLELWLNVNVQNEPQPDFSTPNQYPANAAPAGTYAEVFTFTASAV